MIDKKTRDEIVVQAKKEIIFARTYKQARIRSWKKNEDMYYGRKLKDDNSRAHVELGKMQGFVHTILSKIDNPLVFKFKESKESDRKKAKRINALRERDSNEDDWAIKDLLMKKQAVIYGRAIACYYSDSYNGYKAHLEPVDVYDFLIDPAGGGYDMELAFYMGRYGVIKTRKQLKEGASNKEYYSDTVKQLTKDGSGNATEINQEEVNKQNRYFNFSQTSNRQIEDPDKYKFWEWYTTYEGERYYLLMTDDGICIKAELLKDIFKSDMFPFWSWAAFLDMTEFWTPSFCDYVRELFMAQSININQMLDNAEQINKPMKAVVTKYVENLADLKFRKDGFIRLKETDDIRKAVMVMETPQINTPILVYNTLEAIAQAESGVTAGAKGIADPDGKATIYEGNQANAADRFGLLNKSYAFGYKRFAKLYENGVYENLTKKVAVELIGNDGVEFAEITRRDVKPYGHFNYIVESSDAEQNADMLEKKNKLTWIANTLANPATGKMINPKKAVEISATIAGFSMEDIKELLDVENWADADLMSEAARDIERILDGEDVKPNMAVNIAYKQKIVDWMKDHREDISDEDFMRITLYVQSLEPFVIANTVRAFSNQVGAMAMNQPMNPEMNPENPQEQIMEKGPEILPEQQEYQ